MQGGETKKGEITYYNSDSRPIFSQNGTVMMRVTFLGQAPSVNKPSPELLTYPRTQRKLLLQPGAGGPLTSHGSLGPGTFILTGVRLSRSVPGTACQVCEAQGFLVGGRWAVFMLFGND